MKAQSSALALGKDQGKKAATCCAEIKEAYFPDEVWNFDSLHCITSVWALPKDSEIFIFPSLYFLILHVNTLMAIRQKQTIYCMHSSSYFLIQDCFSAVSCSKSALLMFTDPRSETCPQWVLLQIGLWI